jgi:GNAT superfamily N-acetyltransferase
MNVKHERLSHPSDLHPFRTSSKMGSNFILTEARQDDCEAIAEIEFEACSDDPGFSTIFPNGATPVVLKDYARRFRNDLENDPSCHMYLIRDLDSGGAIVSFATWHFFPERQQSEIDEEMLLDDFHLPEDANREAGNRLIRNGLRKRHEIMGPRPYAYLAATGTSSNWRKQGAASMLLQQGLLIADRNGLPSYVEGTPSAMKLYRKFGFADVEHIKLDCSPWKEGEFFNVCMRRPAARS